LSDNPPIEWFVSGRIDPGKLENYLLSPTHPAGKHKARLWKSVFGLERVMDSIRNGLGMRETVITQEPSRPWNPHSYAVFAQVHNTL
jgi:hypothetical protein